MKNKKRIAESFAFGYPFVFVTKYFCFLLYSTEARVSSCSHGDLAATARVPMV